MIDSYKDRLDIWLKVCQHKISVDVLFRLFKLDITRRDIEKFIKGDLYALEWEIISCMNLILFNRHRISELFCRALIATMPLYDILKNSIEYETFVLSWGILKSDFHLQKIIDGTFHWEALSENKKST